MSELQIERVVCSGGGAKGVVYAGSYRALQDTGLFIKVKELSGASAGAITAAQMATGMNVNVFRNQMLSTNFHDLMGETVGSIFSQNPRGVSFLTKDGKPLEEFVRANIIQNVKTTLAKIDDLEKALLDPGFKSLQQKLQADNPIITFADLSLLNSYFPDHFKQLTLTAVKFPGGELQIFNADLTPDVEIALACRASASIPVFLKPVEIEINGIRHQFIDGGFYDNLPTDYFDKNQDGEYVLNKKPAQTLVMAFGEGLDNRYNPVFQAVYGPRWDEAIGEEFLNTLLGHAMEHLLKAQQFDDELLDPEEAAYFFELAIKHVLSNLKRKGALSAQEEKNIQHALNDAIEGLQGNQTFWEAFNNPQKNKSDKLKLLFEFIKRLMKPILYQASFIEKFKRDVLVDLLGDMLAPYNNTDKKEIGFQKLRSEYALRTIELRVGDITTTDFGKAMHWARVMDSLGYLDTVNYISNHNLQDPEQFNADNFYINIMDKFTHIYEATLAGAGKGAKNDPVFLAMANLETNLKSKRPGISQAEISRQQYYLIRDRVETKLDSMEAFALSRAVEFQNKTINSEQLFKETYEEGFKHASIFSVSKISGTSVFSSSTLHSTLKNQNMFELYAQQSKSRGQITRTSKVFDALSKLGEFSNQTDSQIQGPVLTV